METFYLVSVSRTTASRVVSMVLIMAVCILQMFGFYERTCLGAQVTYMIMAVTARRSRPPGAGFSLCWLHWSKAVSLLLRLLQMLQPWHLPVPSPTETNDVSSTQRRISKSRSCWTTGCINDV